MNMKSGRESRLTMQSRVFDPIISFISGIGSDTGKKQYKYW